MFDPQRVSRITSLDGELERLRKACEAGVAIAVPAALHHCLEWGLDPPSWLIQAALGLLCDLLKREKSQKRGRSSGIVARYRQDMIDFLRFNEVEVLKEHQQRSIECLSIYPRSDMRAEEVARAEWLGSSVSRLYQCVSEVLERTDAFGSPESIKRSYRQVQRRERHPTQAFRYCVLPDPFLLKLGIDGDLGYGRHAKIAAWRSSPLLARQRAGDKRRP